MKSIKWGRSSFLESMLKTVSNYHTFDIAQDDVGQNLAKLAGLIRHHPEQRNEALPMHPIRLRRPQCIRQE